MLAVEGDVPVAYIYHCALEEDGEFGLSLRCGGFLCIPRKQQR